VTPRATHPWAAVVGTLLALVILWDAFQTIILSRRVSRRLRPTRAFYRLVWTPWKAATRRLPPGNRRENVLMVFGPLSLLLLIALWAFGLIGSFAVLHWSLGSALAGPDGASGFGIDLYMSGTTFFTLGLGDVTPRTTLARALTVAESGMGFAFLALVIGYVPLISQAFSRREVSISMLDARAGSPPTAAQLLRRHFREGGEDLRELLRDWERWSAELLESHVSFPVLSYFRSQHDNQSWVAALTTILDVCALVIARLEDGRMLTARLTFAMARHAVVDLCAVFRLPPTPPPTDRLPPAEEKRLESFLAADEVRLRADEASVAKFRTLRAAYEPYVQALSSFLLMPLPEWVPREGVRDTWHTMA
jgi:ion channel